MKGKATKKLGQPPHPWAELAKLTSFTIAQLRVLHQHHETLHRFCVDPETEQHTKEPDLDDGRDGQETTATTSRETATARESSLDMSFEQYVMSVHSLIKYGSSHQQFEYLFQTYAIENERGISRSELFQLLQDHYKPIGAAAASHSASSSSSASGKSTAAETRHFERLYTWLKKHFNVYDRTRGGFLSLHVALELLQTHPDALHHLQLVVEPFLTKLDENNKHYEAKAHAAAIQ